MLRLDCNIFFSFLFSKYSFDFDHTVREDEVRSVATADDVIIADRFIGKFSFRFN